jgi:hypothetical protein
VVAVLQSAGPRVAGAGLFPRSAKDSLPLLSSQTSLEHVFFRQTKLWHPTKNGTLTPFDVTPGSERRVWWRCPRGHEWSAQVHFLSEGKRCPYCAGKKVAKDTSLRARAPRLAKYWHVKKNGDLRPTHVTAGSTRMVWWKCPNGPDHEWEEQIAEAIRKRQPCPYCNNHRASVTNCLATLYPDLAKEWDHKHNEFGPEDVVATSKQRVWWSCPKGPDHVWSTRLVNRTRTQTKCPYCVNLRLSVTNCLAKRAPVLARQWHPTRNGRITPHYVMFRSRKRFWWLCALGHVWLATVTDRQRKGTGCPACARRRRSKPVMRRIRRIR